MHHTIISARFHNWINLHFDYRLVNSGYISWQRDGKWSVGGWWSESWINFRQRQQRRRRRRGWKLIQPRVIKSSKHDSNMSQKADHVLKELVSQPAFWIFNQNSCINTISHHHGTLTLVPFLARWYMLKMTLIKSTYTFPFPFPWHSAFPTTSISSYLFLANRYGFQFSNRNQLNWLMKIMLTILNVQILQKEKPNKSFHIQLSTAKTKRRR